jgi:hypothetical protein
MHMRALSSQDARGQHRGIRRYGICQVVIILPETLRGGVFVIAREVEGRREAAGWEVS